MVGSITWFREQVRPLRAAYRRPDPADRLEHVPGKLLRIVPDDSPEPDDTAEGTVPASTWRSDDPRVPSRSGHTD